MAPHNLKFSKHANERMQQRAIRKDDIRCILRYGSQIDDAVYFLSNKDVDQEIHRHKILIKNLNRLRNKKAVVENNTVITCYHSSNKNQKRTLRQGREYS